MPMPLSTKHQGCCLRLLFLVQGLNKSRETERYCELRNRGMCRFTPPSVHQIRLIIIRSVRLYLSPVLRKTSAVACHLSFNVSLRTGPSSTVKQRSASHGSNFLGNNYSGMAVCVSLMAQQCETAYTVLSHGRCTNTTVSVPHGTAA
jgi:hypothetical protein